MAFKIKDHLHRLEALGDGLNIYRYFDEMIESTLKFGVEAAYTKKK